MIVMMIMIVTIMIVIIIIINNDNDFNNIVKKYIGSHFINSFEIKRKTWWILRESLPLRAHWILISLQWMKITVRMNFNDEIPLYEWQSIGDQIKDIWLSIMWQDCYHVVFPVVGIDTLIGQFFLWLLKRCYFHTLLVCRWISTAA